MRSGGVECTGAVVVVRLALGRRPSRFITLGRQHQVDVLVEQVGDVAVGELGREAGLAAAVCSSERLTMAGLVASEITTSMPSASRKARQ